MRPAFQKYPKDIDLLFQSGGRRNNPPEFFSIQTVPLITELRVIFHVPLMNWRQVSGVVLQGDRTMLCLQRYLDFFFTFSRSSDVSATSGALLLLRGGVRAAAAGDCIMAEIHRKIFGGLMFGG